LLALKIAYTLFVLLDEETYFI